MVRDPASDAARPLSASEQEVLMGIPPGYTEALRPGARDSCLEDARKPAVGSGFHVPSIVLLLSLLGCPQGCQATRTNSFSSDRFGTAGLA